MWFCVQKQAKVTPISSKVTQLCFCFVCCGSAECFWPSSSVCWPSVAHITPRQHFTAFPTSFRQTVSMIDTKLKRSIYRLWCCWFAINRNRWVQKDLSGPSGVTMQLSTLRPQNSKYRGCTRTNRDPDYCNQKGYMWPKKVSANWNRINQTLCGQ